MNLPPRRIRDFIKDTTLSVLFFPNNNQDNDDYDHDEPNNLVVYTSDKTKAQQLLTIGQGNYARLFNIQLVQGNLFVTEQSGIRPYQPPRMIPRPPLSPPPFPTTTPLPSTIPKWQCLWCGFKNFPSKSTCYGCDDPRKAGPMVGDIDHFDQFYEPCIKENAFLKKKKRKKQSNNNNRSIENTNHQQQQRKTKQVQK